MGRIRERLTRLADLLEGGADMAKRGTASVIDATIGVSHRENNVKDLHDDIFHLLLQEQSVFQKTKFHAQEQLKNYDQSLVAEVRTTRFKQGV